MPSINQDTLEQTTPAWFKSLSYHTAYGPTIAPSEPAAERDALLPKLISGEIRVGDQGMRIPQ